ncbi:hypothetical protein BI372_03525 [Acinetobacter pittii]|nr:hypothetical protein BI372_03525 [Acinetobacter pittii]
MLESWGVCPSAMLGHSVGEYVAACVARVFSLEDALGILVKRGQLISQLPESKMIAVHASEEDLRNILDEGVWISVINSKNICNVSGDFISIDKFILKIG